MARNKLFILGMLLVFMIGGYTVFMQGQPSPFSLSQWVHYTAEEGHFEVLFPVAPKHVVTHIPFQSPSDKNVILYNNYVALGDDKTMYLLTEAIYPIQPDVQNAPQTLQNFIAQLISKSPLNKVVREQQITFQNYPALDFTLISKELLTHGRVILAGNRMFVLLCSNSDDAKAESNFHAFADSLVIK